MIRYVVSHRDRDEATKPLRPVRALRKARRIARRAGAPFAYRERGTTRWQQAANAWEAVDGAAKILARADVGTVAQINAGEVAGKPKAELAIRKVEVTPPPIQTVGNAKIDAIYTAVVREFDVGNYGICSRRAIAGTSSWSQHSPWPEPDEGANAWDIGARFTLLEDVAAYLYEQRNALPIGRIIFNRRVWDPERGWHGYYGADPHTSHIHVEGRPERGGTPRATCP